MKKTKWPLEKIEYFNTLILKSLKMIDKKKFIEGENFHLSEDEIKEIFTKISLIYLSREKSRKLKTNIYFEEINFMQYLIYEQLKKNNAVLILSKIQE